jgi:NADPH:quinone reductase-like Zn-dependent oxidoreductase
MTSNDSARVYGFHEYDGPDQLKLESVPLAGPGHGEVRVRVQAMGLNRADLLYLANACIESPRLPSRLGYEVCGAIEAVGPGVTAFAVGDRVSSTPAFPVSDYANFGETATLPERGLMKTPDRLTPARGRASPSPTSPATSPCSSWPGSSPARRSW